MTMTEVTTYDEPGGLALAGGGLSPATLYQRVEEMRANLDIMKRFFREVMVEGEDYGVIPGTDRPSLLKPGAEKLLELYGYAPTMAIIDEDSDREGGYYRARVTVRVVSRQTGSVIAEGVGEANTYEGRYRWRNGSRRCPACGGESIIKGKAEYGGGWVCWVKGGGGCGAKFPDDDPVISSLPTGKVPNEDPWSLWNTILKMAKKRALVDAALSATRSSSIFTQDVEELREWSVGNGGGESPRQHARQDSATRKPAGTRQGTGSDWSWFWAEAKRLGFSQADVHSIAGMKSLTGLNADDRERLMETLRLRVEESAVPLTAGEGEGAPGAIARGDSPPVVAPSLPPSPRAAWSAFWSEAKALGFSQKDVHNLAGTDSLGHLDAAAIGDLLELLRVTAQERSEGRLALED